MEWLELSKMGPIAWADKGFEGEIYKYDYSSLYPAKLNFKILYPFKRGEFKTIDQEEFIARSTRIGIYRCIIPHDDKVSKLFRWNPHNYYVWKDVVLALSLGLTPEVVMDGKPNFLSYPVRSCVLGYKYFGKIVDLLYSIKHKSPKAKKLLKMIWGVLGKRNKMPMVIKNDDKNIMEIKPDRILLPPKPRDKDNTQTLIQFMNINYLYETDHARIAPFVLAYGRSEISNKMKPNIDQIVRCHTDSAFCKTPCYPIEIKEKYDLGEFRFEGFGKIKINNLNDVDGLKEVSIEKYKQKISV